MPPAEEVAMVQCLSEVRTALAGLEAAAQASLRANEVRLHELELRTARESDEARSSAEKDAQHMLEKAQGLESRVGKLEEKLRAKKSEATELRGLVDKLTAKLEAKSQQLLALEDQKAANGTSKVTVATDRQAAAEAAAAGTRAADGSHSSDCDTAEDEMPVKPKVAKEDEGRSRKRKKPPESEEQSCSSDDSSIVETQKRRHLRLEKELRSLSRGDQCSDSSSRSPESRCRERGRGRGSHEHHRSRDRTHGHQTRSCDSRGRGAHGGHRRGDHCSPGRSGSRQRSRSRRPWHVSSNGKGSGANSGKARDREGASLCIPFVMGKCHWGEKCRDRHPDPDDAKLAKENLQNKLCRFGMDCRRKDCIFKHPDGRKRDKG